MTNSGELRAQLQSGKYCLDINLAPFASCIIKRIDTTVPRMQPVKPIGRTHQSAQKEKRPTEELPEGREEGQKRGCPKTTNRSIHRKGASFFCLEKYLDFQKTGVS